MDMVESFRLKKSILIQTLSLAFLMAPFGNLAGELFMSGQSYWYSPVHWIRLFLQLKGQEQVLLMAIALAGAALMVPKKSSWFFAMVVLIWISFHNMHYFLSQKGPVWSIRLVPALFNLPVLIILFYFRYPYLDKRDHIVGGFRPRTNVNKDVLISGQPLRLKSLSLSGCFVEGALPGQTGEVYELELDPGVTVSIQLLYPYKEGWGAKFNDLTKAQKRHIKSILA